MENIRNVQLITENDLCISCGACKHGCPYDEIQIELNAAKGFYEPIVVNTASCITCEEQPCLQVCPSYEEDFVQLANWQDPSQTIGPWHSIYTCHSTSTDIRARSSSGGIIRELCRYYLEKGIVEGVITLRHFEGLDYEPDLYTSVEDVSNNTPGSIYHNINFERAIQILKTRPGNFLLIALPCQLTSIRKWQLTCPEQVVGQVKVTIGLICGWMYSRHTLSHFARYVGVDYADLRNVAYRGGDSIGNFVLKTQDRTETFFRRPQYLSHAHTAPFRVAFSRTYSSQRCLLCVEHLNYLADIVVGDAWLDAFRDDRLGTSIVVVRNSESAVSLEELANLGRIKLAAATERHVIESQGEYFAFSGPAKQVINKLKLRGKFTPRYNLPTAENSLPRFKTWYKNYLNPSWFRYLMWRGWGYPWFLVRVVFFHIRFWLSVPARVGHRIGRVLGQVFNSAK